MFFLRADLGVGFGVGVYFMGRAENIAEEDGGSGAGMYYDKG